MLKIALLTGLLAATPKMGDTAPDFTAVDTEGHTHHLSEMVKHEKVIVAFFPKAFTSGCTRELSAYRDRYTDIQKLGGHVLAISMDSKETLVDFKKSLNAPFAFIPDPEGKLVKLFDVKMPVVSLAQRYSFVVGPDRKILQVQSGKDAINPEPAVAACSLRHSADGSTH